MTCRIILFAAVLLLTACGNEQGEKGTTAETTVEQDNTTTADTTAAESEGGIVMAITSDPAIDQAKLHGKVMELHDEAMDKMSKLNKLKRSLGEMLKDGGAEKMTKETKETVDKLIAQIDAASTGMFDWMNTFKNPKGSMAHDAAMDYLQAEVVKVNKVSVDINKAIEETGAFVEPFEQ